METCSAFLDLYDRKPPVTGGFPSQRPVTRSFDVYKQTEQMAEQKVKVLVIWDATELIITSL